MGVRGVVCRAVREFEKQHEAELKAERDRAAADQLRKTLAEAEDPQTIRAALAGAAS